MFSVASSSIFTGRWSLLLLGLIVGILVSCPAVVLIVDCARLQKEVRDNTWVCSDVNPCGSFPEMKKLAVVGFLSQCLEYRRCMRNHLQKLRVENEKSRRPRAWMYRALLCFFAAFMALEPHRNHLQEYLPLFPIEWLSGLVVVGTVLVEYVVPLLLGFRSRMQPTHCGCRIKP